MVELEVRFELRFIESVTRLAHLLGIEIPVAGGELEAAFLLVDDRLHVGAFPFRIGHRGRREIGEKLVHRRDILRGLIFELISGVVGVAEQRRALRPQLRGPADDFFVIEFAAVAVPRERGLHDLLAQRAILERSRAKAGRWCSTDG